MVGRLFPGAGLGSMWSQVVWGTRSDHYWSTLGVAELPLAGRPTCPRPSERMLTALHDTAHARIIVCSSYSPNYMKSHGSKSKSAADHCVFVAGSRMSAPREVPGTPASLSSFSSLLLSSAALRICLHLFLLCSSLGSADEGLQQHPPVRCAPRSPHIVLQVLQRSRATRTHARAP